MSATITAPEGPVDLETLHRAEEVRVGDNVPAGFVDFHSHLVPGVDDGARDLAEAVRAVETLAGGRHGVRVGIVKGDTLVTPLAEITGKTRPADASLLELARVMAM